MKKFQLTSILMFFLLHSSLGNSEFWQRRLSSGRLNPVAFPQIPYSNKVDNLFSRSDLPVPQDIQTAGAQISQGSELFSFEMFHTIAHAVRKHDFNFIVSPFSIWSLMVLLAEGSAGESFKQLESALHLPSELTYVRTAYRQFERALVVNTSTIELAVNQALFTDINKPVDKTYSEILEKDYEADHVSVNFQNRDAAVKKINDHIRLQTRGKIPDVIKKDDLNDAQMLLTSAIFFKGQWKFPFNTTFTTEQPFYHENGVYAGHVQMMSQRNVFPFAMMNELDASVLELPYGKTDRLCMLLMLPRRNSTLTEVFNKLKNFNIRSITHELHKYDHTEEYEEAEIELSLPRFSIDSDLELRTVLEALGVQDIFDPAKAKLTKISKEPLFVSRVFHRAVIEVNEEGTVATAVSGGTVSFKQTPIEFVANRPFGFLIIDRQTNTLLFAGQVRNPLAQ